MNAPEKAVVFSVSEAVRLSGIESMPQDEGPILPPTRTALVNDADPAFRFGVSEFDGNGNAVSSFQNIEPAYETTVSAGNELFNARKKWEAPAYVGTRYAFYAYSPYLASAANGLALLSGNQTISYSITDLPFADQPDLMTAYVQSEYADPVPLTFQHRLAAVRVSLGSGWDGGCTVTGLTFGNVIPGGILSISASKDADWDRYDSRTDYTLPSGDLSTLMGTTTSYLMMVPQTLSGASCNLTATVTRAGSTHSITIPLSGKWEAGKTYTYTLDPPRYTSMTAVYPKWDDGESGIFGPVSAYEAGGNVFGMYAVTPDGTAVFSNVPVGVSAVSGQVATLNLPDGYYPAGYRYFLYYPFQASPGGSVDLTATDAPSFFADMISGWTVGESQNSAALYKAQDLQVGELTGGVFTMAHTMGLVKVIRSSKVIATTRTFTYGTSVTFTDNGTTSQPAPDFPSTTRFYDSGGHWTIVKSTGALTCAELALTSATGTHGDRWSLSITEVGHGKYKSYSVTSSLDYLQYVGMFPYSGSTQTVRIPWAGTYKLQVWGAEGVSFKPYSDKPELKGGYGGYAEGKTSFAADEIVYVMVGQKGTGGLNNGGRYSAWPNGGYGGAPNLVAYSGSGGGSSHIATASALPKDLTDNQILIMAGGGGAADCHPQFDSAHTIGWGGSGGSGGGYIGNAGTGDYSSFIFGEGGTQSAGGMGGWRAENAPYTILQGKRGQGGPDASLNPDSTGGGGGYYGGGGSWGAGAGGGSGYIGNSRLTEKQMAGYRLTNTSMETNTKTVSTDNVSGTPTDNYAKSGDGYAKITSL